jgi:SNF2 family DNA or RNA helicase
MLGGFYYLQVVAKLHAILRPFLLRRMKADVEQLLPRKKEIILYATMTDHQKNFQDHLINRTLESHLIQKANTGTRSVLFVQNCIDYVPLQKERQGTHFSCFFFFFLDFL